MDLEKKLDELSQKYRVLLREGKTKKATEVVEKAEELKRKHSDQSEEPEQEQKEQEEKSKSIEKANKFEKIKGVGPELAIELDEEFKSIEKLAEAEPEELEPIPGIGKKKAESLLEEVNKIKEGE